MVRPRAQRVELEDDLLAARECDVARRGEPADPVMDGSDRRRGVHVHVLVPDEVGSKATPSRPRSPVESTLRETNGLGSSAPCLITRSEPPCWATKIRPSGATASAVGLVSPAVVTSTKPGGSVEAPAPCDAAATSAAPTSRMRVRSIIVLTLSGELSPEARETSRFRLPRPRSSSRLPARACAADRCPSVDAARPRRTSCSRCRPRSSRSA